MPTRSPAPKPRATRAPLPPPASAATPPAAAPTAAATTARPLLGVDFSSAPSRRKPVVMALGTLHGAVLRLDGLQRFDTLKAFGDALAGLPAWTGGFDLPFGLPRELVESLGWPTDWAGCMDHYTQMTRPAIRERLVAFCDARPAGAKFAHRACDGPAGSSPSMKWVNPPVAWMLHAGVQLLRAAGAAFPAHGDRADATGPGTARVALEAYPGLLAREVIGRRSYKADDRARQTPERLIARKDLVEALEQGRTRLGLRLKLSAAQHEALVADASGDALDAVLCLLQTGWAARQPGWGLPAAVDPLEGWIVSA